MPQFHQNVGQTRGACRAHTEQPTKGQVQRIRINKRRRSDAGYKQQSVKRESRARKHSRPNPQRPNGTTRGGHKGGKRRTRSMFVRATHSASWPTTSKPLNYRESTERTRITRWDQEGARPHQKTRPQEKAQRCAGNIPTTRHQNVQSSDIYTHHHSVLPNITQTDTGLIADQDNDTAHRRYYSVR